MRADLVAAVLKERIPANLPEEVRETLQKYVREICTIFGDRLAGVILYGSAARGEFLPGRSNLNVLVLLVEHDLDLLRRYAKIHRRWSPEKLVVPLFLTERDIQTSHNLFPLEYIEIKEHHVLLSGHDPFPLLTIEIDHLAWQCHQDILGNLLRLRQRFVEGHGKPDALAMLLPLSLTTLLPGLRAHYRIRGIAVPPTTAALLDDLGARFGIDTTALMDVWNLKKGVMTPGPVEVPRLFERYVADLQALAEWAHAHAQSQTSIRSR